MGWDGDLRGGGLRFLLAFALLEAIAVAIHLDNVNMMGEPVQQCAGQRSEPKTSVHSSKGRLLVTSVEARS